MRHKPAAKREIKPDIKFGRAEVAKFINYLMRRGKKSTAQRIMYETLEIISQKTKQDALEIFIQAIKNVEPAVEVRSRRIGGANYQIPVSVRPERRFTLACRWLIEAVKTQKGRPMAEKLAEEILQAYRKEGAAIKKKENVYKMAEANRAFAHFAI